MIDTGFLVGLDLGQADDFSGIVVTQRFEVPDAKAPPPRGWRIVRMGGDGRDAPHYTTPVADPPGISHYRVGHIERLRRVPYPEIVEHVLRLMRQPALAGGDTRREPQLVIDATGVGRPVVDLFRKAGLKPVAVTITGGIEVGFSAGTFTVPKRDLVGALVVLLQSERLKIQKTLPHARTLQAELMNFRVKINTTTAHDSYNAREGEHDDILLAASLACWQGERPGPRVLTGYPTIMR